MKQLTFLFQKEMFRKTFLILFVFAFAAITPTTALAVTVLPEQGVSIAQVDFTWADAKFLDSQTGQVKVDLAALQAATGMPSGYINILTSTGWVVQNLPVLSEFPYPIISTKFDLGASGDITSLFALIDYSPDPVTSFTGSPTTLFPVGTTQFNAQGIGPPVTGGPPNPPPVGVIAFERGGLMLECWQPGHSNVQTAHNQCAPAAVANSFDWLRLVYGTPIPHPHIPGLGDDGSLVGQLDVTMGRTYRGRRDGDGVNGHQILTGKLTYLANSGIHNLDIKHQSAGGLNVPPGDFEAAGLTSVRVPGNPSPDWIFQQICKGEDVELVYVWDGSGHMVEVVGAGYTLGSPFIYYVSDHFQTDDDTLDQLGTDIVDFSSLEDTDQPPDGRVNLVGEEGTPNAELVVSESPRRQTPTLTEWGVIILVALIVFSTYVVLRRRKAVVS